MQERQLHGVPSELTALGSSLKTSSQPQLRRKAHAGSQPEADSHVTPDSDREMADHIRTIATTKMLAT